MEHQHQLNEHNKEEYPPMHTAEHILNQTMIRMFGCGRSVSAHIERRKSKCDYLLEAPPTHVQIKNIEDKVNQIIQEELPVTIEYIDKGMAQEEYDLERLPIHASPTLRIVRIGNYDACPCIGIHVENTREIGLFAIISSDYREGKLRLRFKLL